jgi:electron transfer flavoprotein alpha subunit
MSDVRKIWVLPEIGESVEASSKTALGLLTEAVAIADEVSGSATALIFGAESREYSEVLKQFGINDAIVFTDPLFEFPSAEAYGAALLKKLREEEPWLLLMGDTVLGQELAPRLAVSLDAGLVSSCARIDLSDIEKPVFYRYAYGDQLFQEIVLATDRTMLVTMDSRVLNVSPVPSAGSIRIEEIASDLSPDALLIKHLEYLPVDFRTVDVAEADTIVSAGMGAATDRLLPLVEELANLVEGTVGTTRPVIDEGKIPREKMIGQTGKMVSPDLYLALGISGATYHTGGIQDSGKIVAINRDPRAAIFRTSDVGIAADLREVLPALIEKIKKARKDGAIL